MKRVPLYERLPEIYRLRDAEIEPPAQLQHFLAVVERAFGYLHENIETLYDDLFVETASDWAVPYIGDLLGTSHLSGEPRTIRADVADTIRLRRRKGTLSALELLAFDLTGWAAHCVELREMMVWSQHLNHQRPDAGGNPPYAEPDVTRHTVPRGGTATVRDPAVLSLLGSPFDPFAYVADVRPPSGSAMRINLPNLAVFLWRLAAYRVDYSLPVSRGIHNVASPAPGEASRVVCFDVDPLGLPLVLFNTYRNNTDAQPPILSRLDEMPAPMHPTRLTTDAPGGRPDSYVTVETYNAATNAGLDLFDTGLQLHVPSATFAGATWRFRGANLCAWEQGLRPPLRDREIAIDPVIGRIAIGVTTNAQANALVNSLLLTYTYGAVGPVGAHPVTRPAVDVFTGPVESLSVNYTTSPNDLRDKLANLDTKAQPVVIEIEDSMTYDLDLDAVQGRRVEAGGPNLALAQPLVIRAAFGQRPVIRLAKPLRFRPARLTGPNPTDQDTLLVRMEGLHIARGPGFAPNQALIARAAVHKIELLGCTLDPGGHRQLDDTRAPVLPSVKLTYPYGFTPADAAAFQQVPEVAMRRTVTGPVLVDREYRLALCESIVDAGAGPGDDPALAFAIANASDPADEWAARASVERITVFGRTRVERIDGSGGIFVHALEVLNDQVGCLKFCCFSGVGDRLPQNHGCVHATDAHLGFTSVRHRDPGYAQLSAACDVRIRERGPDDDEMGAFGFLLSSHRVLNLNIRFREFMPVGVRPLLIPVT